MSTRAIYSFYGEQGDGPFHVYKHCDGYPTGAADALTYALAEAWPLPRYEADAFAAAFVAANMTHWKAPLLKAYAEGDAERIKHLREYEKGKYRQISGGEIRLLPSGEPQDVAPGDIEYRYEIRCLDGVIHVKAFSTKYWYGPQEVEIFTGTLAEFTAWADKDDEAA